MYERGEIPDEPMVTVKPMAATNKCLAQNNKSRRVTRATKDRHEWASTVADMSERYPLVYRLLKDAGHDPAKAVELLLGSDYFLVARGFTTSRAQSMNSFTTGASVRFFSVMTPTGQGSIGRCYRQDLEPRKICAEPQHRVRHSP